MNSRLHHYFDHARCGNMNCAGFGADRDRIVFTASKGLPGVGFSRAEWNAIKDLQSRTNTRFITRTAVPIAPLGRTLESHAPIALQDRELEQINTPC